ncbi:MAG: GNAT family N-acetyltransferase, partial [Candidatus Krumholzibacteria bacterium]
NPLGFVFVALDPHDAVLGFVSGTTSVRRLYRSLLLRRGWRYVAMVARSVFNREGLRRVVETMLYPVRGDHSAADAELLSIVVREEARGTGVAAGLLAALLNEFRERGCRRAKLVVNAELVRAHAFYRKHGFESAGTILHHGRPSNVLVIDIDAKTGPLGRDSNRAGTP